MRHVRILVLILCACFASAAFCQSGNPLNNWSEFLRANMARYNPYEDTLGVSNVPNLQMKWACPVGTDMISSPVVAGGVVYLQASYDDSANVVALKNGSVLWVFEEGIDTGVGPRLRWPMAWCMFPVAKVASSRWTRPPAYFCGTTMKPTFRPRLS